ncbi:MAG: CDP-diacylglycerol--glycerol-3-phosphate 3-phosphatidyltransferase [Oscillospiraceae bacterium]|nr:CDP-diacylglycerol--glycerol-3-phosphate 3-phosphatidyltransferase [Oscillospiraceae bacterium]
MQFIKLKYIPNILSVIRIMMVPLFIYLFFGYYERIYLSLCIYLLAGLTDIVDGFLARRFNWITNTGKLLDPLADKFMQCSVLVCFTVKGFIPWWLVVLFVFRELFMICGGIIVLKKIKMTVKSNWYGKGTTAVFYAIAFAVFIFKLFNLNVSVVIYVVLFTLALMLALLSMVMYIIDTLHINAELKKSGKL